MGPHKRMLLWDYTNTQGCPNRINDVPFGKGLISSVSNWNSWTPPELKNRAPFRPMLHDLAKVPPTNDWNMFANSNDPILLYLNEPERDNRTPQQAADVWTRDVIPLRQKKHCRLCSPSCANDPKGQNWLKDWMNIVRGRNQMPDFIGVHWYGESADDCKKFLEGIHNQWPGIPIMVTEIASISRDYNSVLHFTADMGLCSSFLLQSLLRRGFGRV